jgi:hypothetical protein
MLETLAGRLKWERTGDGIRVELPAPLDWPNTCRVIVPLAFAECLIIWVSHGFHPTSTVVGVFTISFALLYAAPRIWQILARRTILTPTPAEMALNRGTLECRWNRRVFANGRVHNLRYCESRKEPTAEREPVKNCLLCDLEGRTIAIMSGITGEEATILIERMMAIYKFPK